MTPQAIERAATLLAELRDTARAGRRAIDDLPLACRPTSLEEAYAIQAALAERLEGEAHGGPRIGWKIGCTTAVMQHYLHIHHPCAGHLYSAGLYHERAELRAAGHLQLGLECELAVRLGADLETHRGGHRRASVAPAVAEVMTSVEIVEHRFADFSAVAAPSLVADDFFSVGCVLGTALPADAAPDLATLRGGFHIDGAAPGETGSGAAILGHPLDALAWLAEHAAAHGEPLRRGQVVSLGSVVKTVYPAPGSHVEARFEGLAPVHIRVR